MDFVLNSSSSVSNWFRVCLCLLLFIFCILLLFWFFVMVLILLMKMMDGDCVLVFVNILCTRVVFMST